VHPSAVVLALALPLLARGADDPLDGVRARLADESPGTRRRAVLEAAALGGEEAWGLVVLRLADPEPEVGDEAQLALAQLSAPEALEQLLRDRGLGSRDERVRLRAAEGLGRVPLEVDAGELAKRLTTREPGFSRALLHSVERLALAGRLAGDRGRLERAARKVLGTRRDPGLRGDALVALAAMGCERREQLLLDALGDREPALRCAALLAAREAGLASCATWTVALAADEDAAVRVQALENLERQGDLDALRALVTRIEEEPRARLRWRALEALQRLTGMKYRFDTRPWRLWIDGRSAGWRPEPGSRGPEEPDRAGATRAGGLVGMPLLSDRICFLFDFSGSMWTRLEDGRTPKDVVAERLRSALQHLPEETEFNVVPFTYDPIPWEPGVVPARRRNVEAALEFFEACREVGKGNFWDAALFALGDPRVDTLVVLTDGVPTGGTHCDMDLILPLFEHANRYRKVAVDAILVDAPPGSVRRWRELSRRTGGRSIEVELDAP